MSLKDAVLETIKAHPGLTKDELASKLSESLGRTIEPISLRLGDLGLAGLVREQKEEKQVFVTKVLPTYYAV